MIPAECRYHDLRQIFGSRCAEQGIAVMAIKDLMGHASEMTTLRRMHAGEDHKLRAFRHDRMKWQEYSEQAVTSTETSRGSVGRSA